MRHLFRHGRSLVFLLALACTALPAADAGRAKYVFMFIGDGMGIVQRHVAEAVLRHQTRDPQQRLAMNQLPVQGLTTTHAASSPITDSAAAGTALACGVKTLSGRLSVLPNGQSVPTIAEQAKAAGRRVGIVTSVSIDHATPAAFYAHCPLRADYYEIACALSASGFDYFGGGQAKGDQPNVRKDRPSPVALARDRGYQIVDSLEVLRQATPGTKVWAFSPVVDGSAALPYEMDQEPGGVPLVEFVAQGIRLLDNPDGFFLMVEGGRIDWACHLNDPRATVTETLAMDRTVGLALEFLAKRPDETLVVVTADHETGGMTFGRTFTGYAFHPGAIVTQPASYDKLLGMAKRLRENQTPYEEAAKEIAESFAFGTLSDWETDVLRKGLAMTMVPSAERAFTPQEVQDFGMCEPLPQACLRIVSARAGIGWGSFHHTGTPVQTSAAGVGAERFGGLHDNTDICIRMRDLMGLAE